MVRTDHVNANVRLRTYWRQTDRAELTPWPVRTQNDPMDMEDIARLVDRAIGNELLHQREKRGISRATLTKLSGVAPKTIQRFEEGKRSPDQRQLFALTHALGLSMREFVELALKDVDGVNP